MTANNCNKKNKYSHPQFVKIHRDKIVWQVVTKKLKIKKNIIIYSMLFLFNNVTYSADLIDIYKIAEKNDPLTHQEREMYNARKEEQAITRAALLPRITLDARRAQVIIEHVPKTRKYYFSNYDIKLNQTLFDWEKWNKYVRSEPIITSAEQKWYAANQDLILRVAQTYFNILNAIDVIEYTEKQYNAINELLNSTKERFKVGQVTIADLEQVQANLEQTSADLIQAKTNLDNNREKLQEITNITTPQLVRLKDKFNLLNIISDQNNTLSYWVDLAKRYNLQLLSANADRLVAKNNISIAQANYLPTVNLTSQYRGSDSRQVVEQFLNARQGPFFAKTFSVNLEINSPNINPYGSIAQNSKALADYQQADQKYIEVYRTTEQLVSQYYREMISFSNQSKALEHAVKSNQSSLDATMASFEVGTKTYTDVLNSITNLYSTKRDYKLAIYNYLMSILQLKNTAGHLDINDLGAINAKINTKPENRKTKEIKKIIKKTVSIQAQKPIQLPSPFINESNKTKQTETKQNLIELPVPLEI